MPLTADLGVHAAGERVDHGDAHAVQAARDGVAAAAELAAGVQDRHDDLDGRPPLGGVQVHGDAAAVVRHAHAAVGLQRDVDAGGVAGQRLVHGVVHDLVHEVMQAPRAGGADVHAGALADGLEALEHGDGAGAVLTGHLPVLHRGLGLPDGVRHGLRVRRGRRGGRLLRGVLGHGVNHGWLTSSDVGGRVDPRAGARRRPDRTGTRHAPADPRGRGTDDGRPPLTGPSVPPGTPRARIDGGPPRENTRSAARDTAQDARGRPPMPPGPSPTL